VRKVSYSHRRRDRMALTAPTAGGGRAGRERVGMGGERVSLPRRPGSRESRTRASSTTSARVESVGSVGSGASGKETVGGHHRLVAEMESVRERDEGERGRARGRTSVVRDEDLADDPRASSGEHIVLVLYLGSSHCGRGEGRVRRRCARGQGAEPVGSTTDRREDTSARRGETARGRTRAGSPA
jgi:hypothetical protein